MPSHPNVLIYYLEDTATIYFHNKLVTHFHSNETSLLFNVILTFGSQPQEINHGEHTLCYPLA